VIRLCCPFSHANRKLHDQGVKNIAVPLRFVRFAGAVRAVCGRCSSGLRSLFVRFAVAVRAVCGCGSCGLRLRCVQFAVAVRAICGCGSCGLRLRSVRFFHHAVRAVFLKPCRRVPTFPEYNDYHTLSNYKIYISILRLYLYTGTRDMNFTVGYK
jgi:hypothetical protein